MSAPSSPEELAAAFATPVPSHDPLHDERALALLAAAAPDWLPRARLAWLAAAPLALRGGPPLTPRSYWRHACCLGCVAALLAPASRETAFVAGLLAPCALACGVAAETGARPIAAAIARRWNEPAAAEALADADSTVGCALDAAAWLLALKRMRGPLATSDPSLAPERLARLGLGAEGLVGVLAGLGDAVDHGRRLARAALEAAETARRRR